MSCVSRHMKPTEQVMVKPSFERLQIVPARYETVTEEITIGEKRYAWKLGTNLSNTRRVDEKTGQVYCLVEIPAKTTTVTKRVLVEPEQVKRVTEDAKYISVSKEVLVDRGGVEEIPVPAEFKNIPTVELAVPARTETQAHAPKTEIVERTVLRAPEKYEWVEVLCDTNATTASMSSIQQALADRGFYKGPIDGIMGPMTMTALGDFQSSVGLPHQGYITMDTLSALGLAEPRPAKHPVMPQAPHKAPVSDGASLRGTEHSQAGMAPVQPAYETMTSGEAVVMQPEVVSHEMEGQVQQVAPQEARDAIEQQTKSYQRPREYSVRKRLDWDGK